MSDASLAGECGTEAGSGVEEKCEAESLLEKGSGGWCRQVFEEIEAGERGWFEVQERREKTVVRQRSWMSS